MKTLILGGGKECQLFLELLTTDTLKELNIDILGVIDLNANAPGMIYASLIGIPTYSNLNIALKNKDIEFIIELIENSEHLNELSAEIKSKVKIIDHSIANMFLNLINLRVNQNNILESNDTLENEKILLQNIFDSYTDLDIVMDLKYKIIKANSKFLQFTNLKREKIIGEKLFEVIKNNQLMHNTKKIAALLDEVLINKRTSSFISGINSTENKLWEIICSPMFDEKNNVSAFLLSWHKITNEVFLKRRVEEAESILNSFINSALDWISIKDMNGRYLLVNPPTADAFGFKPSEFIGKKPEELLTPELAIIIDKHDKEVIESKQAHTYKEIIPVRGKNHILNTTRFPLTDYKGEIIGVCTIGRDITNEFRLQEQLIQSEKLVALGKLAAGVAHEINNPLTGILAYTEDIIEDADCNSKHKDDLEVILRETLRCRDIVLNLLDFTRQDNPKFEINDANTILENVLSLITKLPQFRNIIIQKKIDSDLPHIQSDPNQIQQVFLNLLLNAAESMKFKGYINIKTKYDNQKNMCIISVEDEGAGIPDEYLERIFEPFFSTKGTTGLGLAVCKGIIERHRGYFEVKNVKPKGAIFKVLLPIYSQE